MSRYEGFMLADALKAYRQLRALPLDWQPDYSQEWNWFKIGWDECAFAAVRRLEAEAQS